MRRKIAAGVFVLLAFNFLFFRGPLKSSEFVIPSIGSLGFLLFIVSANLFLYLALSRSQKEGKDLLALKSSFLAGAFSFISLFTASPVENLILSLASLLLTLGAFYFLSLNHFISSSLMELFFIPPRSAYTWAKAVIPAWSEITAHVGRLSDVLFRRQPSSASSTKVGAIILGLIVSLPVVIVITLLLSSADPIFEKIVRDLFSFRLPNISEWIVVRIVSSIVFLAFATPFMFAKITESFKVPFTEDNLRSLKTPVLILVCSVAFVLSFFVIVEFPYLFTKVSEVQLSQFGVRTYSEYVRRGFLELMAVSLIVFSVSSVAVVVQKAQGFSGFLKKASLFLLSVEIVFILSVLRRIYLYQIFHGLSRIRVYGSALLLLLLVLAAFLAIRHGKNLSKKLYLYEISVILGTIFILGIVNIDNLIARHFPPTVNGQTDYVYISALSADAYEGWVLSYNHAISEIDVLSGVAPGSLTEEEVRRLIYADRELNNLIVQYRYLVDKYGKEGDYLVQVLPFDSSRQDFKTRNFAEWGVYKKILRGEFIDVVKLVEYYEKSSAIFRSLPFNVRNTTPLDRSLSFPLIP